MLKKIKDDATRLSLLGNYLESIKGTVFRQTQFAEFELRMHEMVEQGQPLTGDTLSRLYAEIVKRYYGHDHGVCIVTITSRTVVGMIPTSTTRITCSSTRLHSPHLRPYPKILPGEPGTTERYLAFISGGHSKYPIDLLKEAGVDMTTDEPLELTVQKMNRVMDQMESMLEKGTREKDKWLHQSRLMKNASVLKGHEFRGCGKGGDGWEGHDFSRAASTARLAALAAGKSRNRRTDFFRLGPQQQVPMKQKPGSGGEHRDPGRLSHAGANHRRGKTGDPAGPGKPASGSLTLFSTAPGVCGAGFASGWNSDIDLELCCATVLQLSTAAAGFSSYFFCCSRR